MNHFFLLHQSQSLISLVTWRWRWRAWGACRRWPHCPWSSSALPAASGELAWSGPASAHASGGRSSALTSHLLAAPQSPTHCEQGEQAHTHSTLCVSGQCVLPLGVVIENIWIWWHWKHLDSWDARSSLLTWWPRWRRQIYCRGSWCNQRARRPEPSAASPGRIGWWKRCYWSPTRW